MHIQLNQLKNGKHKCRSGLINHQSPTDKPIQFSAHNIMFACTMHAEGLILHLMNAAFHAMAVIQKLANPEFYRGFLVPRNLVNQSIGNSPGEITTFSVYSDCLRTQFNIFEFLFYFIYSPNLRAEAASSFTFHWQWLLKSSRKAPSSYVLIARVMAERTEASHACCQSSNHLSRKISW